MIAGINDTKHYHTQHTASQRNFLLRLYLICPFLYQGTLLVGGRFDTSFSQNEAMTTAVRSEARRRQKEVFARDRAKYVLPPRGMMIARVPLVDYMTSTAIVVLIFAVLCLRLTVIRLENSGKASMLSVRKASRLWWEASSHRPCW